MFIRYNESTDYWEYQTVVSPDTWVQLPLNVTSVSGLTIASGKSLTVNNILTFSGTDSSTLNIGTGGTLGTGAYAAIANYALVGQTFYLGTTNIAINRGSGALSLAGITNITPATNFTLTQNSVVPFTSVESGAIVNTFYLKEGNVGIGTADPLAKLHVVGGDGTICFRTSGGTTHVMDLMVNDMRINLGYLTGENDPKIMWYSGGPGGTDVANWDCALAAIGRTWAGIGRGYLRLRAEHFEIVSNYDDAGTGSVNQSLKFRDYGGSSVIQHATGGGINFATDNSNLDTTSLVGIRLAISSGGDVKVTNLAGSGTRNVVVNSDGTLSAP